MDFEFSEEQELLRESVRRFLAERAPMAYVRSQLDDERGTTDAVWAGPRRPGRHRAARTGVGGRRRDGDGRPRAGARGARAGRAPGPVRVVGRRRGERARARGRRSGAADVLPGLAAGTSIGTVALLEPGRRSRLAVAGDRRRVRRRHVALDRHQGARARRGRRRRRRRLARRSTVSSRCSSSTTSPPTVSPSSRRRRSTARARREHSSCVDAPATRLQGADVGAAIAETVDRMHVAAVVDGVGAAVTRARDRGRVREGAPSVRRAHRIVPGRPAPVRGHAARRRARASRRVLRVLGV